MISGPGIDPGQEIDTIVQHEDLCPTILEMAQTQLPPMPHAGPHLTVTQQQLHETAGASLLNLCSSGRQRAANREAAYIESYNSIWSIDYKDWVRTIRTPEFRYTYYAGDQGEQLFDLRTDLDESDNKAHDIAYHQAKEQLRSALFELVVRQDWPKTRRNLFALGVH